MPDRISQLALNRATLERQLLLRRAEIPALQAVEHLVGLQAQAPFSSYYQLWSRLADFSPDDLAQPLLDREVVRIVVMRGTIHLVSAADALTLRPLTQSIMDRDLTTNALYRRALRGLDLEKFIPMARELLEAEALTPAEIGEALAPRFPDRDRKALAQAARNTLALVQVPPRGVWGESGQPRLTTVEAWLGAALDPSPSMRGVLLRYLGAFGPASVMDMQTWSGLTRLREVVEPLRPRLRTFRDDDGTELFDLPDAPRPGPDTPAAPRFLPDFDNLIRSHASRTRVISDENRKRMNTRNGVTPNALLVDGLVAGSWRIRAVKRTATLEISPFRVLTAAEQDAVGAEGDWLLDFAHPGAEHQITF